MASFESVHQGRVVGSLAMFDRMIFKGHLLRLYHPGGVQALLWNQGVPLTKFSEWAKETVADPSIGVVLRLAERVAGPLAGDAEGDVRVQQPRAGPDHLGPTDVVLRPAKGVVDPSPDGEGRNGSRRASGTR